MLCVKHTLKGPIICQSLPLTKGRIWACFSTTEECILQNNLNKLRSGLFSSLLSQWDHTPVNTLMADVWDPKQRTQLGHAQIPDLWKFI